MSHHKTRNILLFGKDGQVGWQLQRSLSLLGEVVALGREACDLARPEAIRRVFSEVKPDIVVNAAAYTDVEGAEADRELAKAVNTDAVAVMAEEARKVGALLVHYSSDYVFDGRKSAPYTELDSPSPLCVYGATKWAGEEAVRACAGRSLILRVGWVFGARGRSFVKVVLRQAAGGGVLSYPADQWGSPTPAAFISDATGLILAASHHGDTIVGNELFHLAAKGAVSRYEFARAILSLAEETPGFALAQGQEALQSTVGVVGEAGRAQRPINTCLATDKIEAAYGITMPDWRPYLRRMMQLLALKSANGY